MSVTYQDYINTLNSSIAQRILKIEILDNNENIIDELSSNVIEGDIQLSDETGSRRNANVTFENTSGLYIPDPDGNIWMNRKFRIWTGLKVNSEDYYISRGIFVCSEPEISSNLSENIVSIQMLDKFALLNNELGGSLENTYIIPVNSSIVDVVKQILLDAGEVKPPIIEPTSELTPYTITKEAGSTYGDLLIELANMLSWTCYFDRDGYFRFEPPASLDTTGSSWDFTTSEIFYLNSKHRYEFSKVFNNVVVIGDNINGSTVRAVSSDTNINSPTRISKIGKKTLVINDNLIYNNDLAQQRADAELQKSISLVETTNISSIPIDFLEGGQIITITDTSSDLNGDRFLIKNISFPLITQGDMSMQAWKGRLLT